MKSFHEIQYCLRNPRIRTHSVYRSMGRWGRCSIYRHRHSTRSRIL